MKQSACLISLLIVLALIVLDSIAVEQTATPQNLILNSSFEQGNGTWPVEWNHSVGENGETSWWLGDAHDGDYSIALLKGFVEWETDSFIPIETELFYHRSFWYYLSQPLAEGEDFRSFIVFFDENGTELYSSVWVVSNPKIGSWQEIQSRLFITDQSVTEIKIRFTRNSLSDNTNPAAFLKIDDVKLIRLDEDIN